MAIESNFCISYQRSELKPSNETLAIIRNTKRDFKPIEKLWTIDRQFLSDKCEICEKGRIRYGINLFPDKGKQLCRIVFQRYTDKSIKEEITCEGHFASNYGKF